MKGIESHTNSLEQVLGNGLLIRNQEIIEEKDKLTFIFTFDRPVVDISTLSELWKPGSPNSVIYAKMVERGWIKEDFTVLHHFQMNIDVNTEECKVKFEYYIPDSEQNAGLRHMN